MSTTTETTYVRGTTSARLLLAIETLLQGHELHGTRKVAQKPSADLPADTRHVAIARHGAWFAIATDQLDEVDAWGSTLSKLLARSVLTLFTWDGEASVVAERWKDGESRAKLELLHDAYRDKDGHPRAPAKVLWPWLPKAKRAKVLRQGVKLSDDEDDEEEVFASLEDSVPALLGTIEAPLLSPWLTKNALVLEFTPRSAGAKKPRAR